MDAVRQVQKDGDPSIRRPESQIEAGFRLGPGVCVQIVCADIESMIQGRRRRNVLLAVVALSPL